MFNAQTPESTATLYRPHQVEEARDELKRLEGTLDAPPHIRARISDVGEMRRRRDNVRRELAQLTPQAYSANEKDGAVKEYDRLEGEIAVGMLSQEELRRNPPGAVQKHMAWEKRNIKKIMRLKHLGSRLAAGGDLPARVEWEAGATNIERFRPHTTFSQLPMDHAQIPKTRDIHFGDNIAHAVPFTDEEIEIITKTSPLLAAKLALLPVEMRAAIKDLIPKLKKEFRPVSRAEDGEATVSERRRKLQEHPFTRARLAAQKAGIKTFGRKRIEVINELKDKGIPY